MTETEEVGRVFLIAGGRYPLPDVGRMTMLERRILWEMSGLVEEDFVQEEGETEDEHEIRVHKLTRHPGFLEALMHIAYQRGNPGLTREKVQAVIEGTYLSDAVAEWEEDLAEVPPAPAETSEPEPSSPRSSSGSSGSSGNGSTATSDEPAAIPASTGTPVSATSSPPTPEPTSVS